MRIFFVALLLGLTFLTGCQKELCEPPELETLALPATFHVHKSKVYLGSVTVPASGDPTFQAAPGLPDDKKKSFQKDFAQAIQGDASFIYHVRRKDIRAKCGMTIPKGKPEYADAIRRHFDSKYYDVSQKPPTEK